MPTAHQHQPLGQLPSERLQRPRAFARAENRAFARHYLEMVIVMFVGMAVLGVPAGWALGLAGSSWSELNADAPSLMLVGMAATMTVPMVAWMRHRGHAWRPSGEMAASMIVPTLAAITVLEGGLSDDVDLVVLLEHVAMLAGMLVAMLARRDEYSHSHARGNPTEART